MIKLHHNIYIAFLLVLTSVAAWGSCAEDHVYTEEKPIPEAPQPSNPQPEEPHPIAFASVTADQESITRAMTLGKDFVVYGYKMVGDEEQTVFDEYTVKYLAGSAHTSADNTHSYYYVFDEQTLKYWDFAATEYHFWGAWRATSYRASFSEGKHNILTIHNVPLRVGEPAPEDDVLFSALYERRPVSSDVVQLSFKRPYAQLRVQFYTSEPLKGDDVIQLTNIRFAPDPDASDLLVNKVYAKGDVVVTYPLSGSSCTGNVHETVTVKNYNSPQDNLGFKDVTLDTTYGMTSDKAVTAPVDDSGAYFYYPLPMGELNPSFTMTASVDDEEKTAVVPATYMQWKANYVYTYIFKITEAGKKIEFYDVKIDPWHYGGSQKEEWKNW